MPIQMKDFEATDEVVIRFANKINWVLDDVPELKANKAAKKN